MTRVIRGGATRREQALREELSRITQQLRRLPDIESAYVFGSLIGGGVHPSSDLDVLVVRRTDEGFIDRALTLQRELLPRVTIDLFVYTPEEFRVGGGFIDRVRAHGRRLW